MKKTGWAGSVREKARGGGEDGHGISGRTTLGDGIGENAGVVGRSSEVIRGPLFLELPLLISGGRGEKSKEVLCVAFFFLLLEEGGVIVVLVTVVIERAGGGVGESRGVGDRG